MASSIRLPIWLVLAVTFGGLATLAIVVVAWGINRIAVENTTDLVNVIAERELLTLEQSLRSELDPALQEVTFLAEYMRDGKVGADDDQRLTDLLMGSLSASPQINGVVFIRPDLQAVVAGRQINGEAFFTSVTDGLRDSQIRETLRAGQAAQSPVWDRPTYIISLGQPLMTALAPVRIDGEFAGVFAAVVSLPVISRRLEEATVNPNATPFVLIDDGIVFAHRNLFFGGLKFSADRPLPHFDKVGDAVLAAFDVRLAQVTDSPSQRGPAFLEQDVYIGDGHHLIIFKYAPSLLGMPLTIGVHVPFSEVEQVFVALESALYRALIVILVAIVLALILGLLIGRPMRALADATSHLAALSFGDAPTLRHSRFSEIDIAADAYNRMRSGLGWFSTYVPRTLVPLLMRADSNETLASREVEVTVLFTDIVGFSGIAQRLSARRLAAFLNRHFSLLGSRIEAEGGSIDKYIGDSIMAFWGAPEAQPDHAARAARAALAIHERLSSDNARRAKKGLSPVRIRIGIHSGRAIAGNIGAPGRINYTLVGDTVNIAQRLEQFGKQVDDGSRSAVISLSADTAQLLPSDLPLTPLGHEVLPGRKEATEIYRLGNGG
ncbi:adenylate/guanylate cyclase domain-containing protein [Dongia sp.]|uniref:adenylate/guanylate cyclase domain-containing protein n=1 Tax=Dongia sp. TaxID=1977262 RepID=UPI0035B2216E